jgi:hypothetical protein
MHIDFVQLLVHNLIQYDLNPLPKGSVYFFILTVQGTVDGRLDSIRPSTVPLSLISVPPIFYYNYYYFYFLVYRRGIVFIGEIE